MSVEEDDTIDTYYQIDEVKENLDETDETPNENRLQNWGNQIDRYLDSKLKWLFNNDLTVFPLTVADWEAIDFGKSEMDQLQDLSTKGLEQKFWKETNGDAQGYSDWEKEVKVWIKEITAIPATSEVSG